MRENKYAVKEYQKGDAEKRLSLFLERPSLRREFIKIEQGKFQPEAVVHHGSRGKLICNPFARLLKW